MYIIIKKDKAEHLDEKLHKIKHYATEVIECLKEAAEEHYEHEEYEHDMARGRGGRYMERGRSHEDDFEDDERYMARGRRGRGRGRY